jgi:hypothetical protein
MEATGDIPPRDRLSAPSTYLKKHSTYSCEESFFNPRQNHQLLPAQIWIQSSGVTAIGKKGARSLQEACKQHVALSPH